MAEMHIALTRTMLEHSSSGTDSLAHSLRRGTKNQWSMDWCRTWTLSINCTARLYVLDKLCRSGKKLCIKLCWHHMLVKRHWPEAADISRLIPNMVMTWKSHFALQSTWNPAQVLYRIRGKHYGIFSCTTSNIRCGTSPGQNSERQHHWRIVSCVCCIRLGGCLAPSSPGSCGGDWRTPNREFRRYFR